jgi:hypothetical protein
LQRTPGMLLAQQLLDLGRSEAVVAYLQVCAHFEYPAVRGIRTWVPIPASPPA